MSPGEREEIANASWRDAMRRQSLDAMTREELIKEVLELERRAQHAWW